MPYTVPYNTFPGSEPPPQRPGVVRLDEPLNASYLQTIGIYSLDDVAISQYQLAGEQTTSKGNFLTYRVAVGNAAEGIHYETALLIDVLGNGAGSVQFADRPNGTFGPLVVAPSSDAPTSTPGNTQAGDDATKQNSTDAGTEGQTTTTTQVDEQTQETVNTTDYTPTDAGGTYQTQPVAQDPQPGDYGATAG